MTLFTEMDKQKADSSIIDEANQRNIEKSRAGGKSLGALFRLLAAAKIVGSISLIKIAAIGSIIGVILGIGYGLVETVDQGHYQVRKS